MRWVCNEIGARLLKVKEVLGHGKFGEWLKAEFDWGEWTARKMMSVAASFKTVNFTDLKIPASALYLLASDSARQNRRQCLRPQRWHARTFPEDAYAPPCKWHADSADNRHL
jgi:predicted LPLAT superfamily acyltransferase